MAIDNEIKDLLNDFGKQLVTDIQKSLKSKQKDQSLNSRLSTSIKPETTFESGGITFKLKMNDYWDAVNSGRSETRNSGDGALRRNLINWIKTRKLKVEISKRKTAKATTLKNKKIKKVYKKQTYETAVENLAFVIARKIHKDGYEGNHFFDEVINDGRTEKLKKNIAELIETDVIVNIQQATK